MFVAGIVGCRPIVMTPGPDAPPSAAQVPVVAVPLATLGGPGTPASGDGGPTIMPVPVPFPFPPVRGSCPGRGATHAPSATPAPTTSPTNVTPTRPDSLRMLRLASVPEGGIV